MTQETFTVGPGIDDILFLDDMMERHRAFMNRFGMNDKVRIWQCTTAAQAIELIDRMEKSGHFRIWQCTTAAQAIELIDRMEKSGHFFQQVFLDHDLCLDDIMCPPGGPSKVPTGMTVVDRICEMPWERSPREAIIHSMNEPASKEMVRRLTGSLIQARWVPFHLLVA